MSALATFALHALTNVATIAIAATAVIAQAPQTSAQPATSDRIALVLDASGSMTAKLTDGQTRFDAARAAIGDVVDTLPATTSVGLRVYGHQSPTADKNCNDTQLVVGFGGARERAAAIRTRLTALVARGYTPLAKSLEEAAKDLTAAGGASGGTIILVSDGKETCGVDPCAMAKALAAANAALVVHTIGFGVDAATRNQLQCIASVARGSYYDANSRRVLLDRLADAARQPALSPPARGPATNRTGTIILKGPAGIGTGITVEAAETNEIVEHFGAVDASPAVKVKAGIYRVRFQNGMWSGVVVTDGQTTTLTPAYFSIAVEARQNVELRDPETREEVMAVHMSGTVATPLIPGRYVLTAGDQTFEEVELKEGVTTEFKPAVIRFVTDTDFSRTYRVRQQPSGVTIDSGPDQDVVVPPGRYAIDEPNRASGQSIRIEIGPGERRELQMGK